MTETAINLPDLTDTPSVVARIDAAVAAAGLTVTMKGTLRTYPDSTHWHCKCGCEKGTLEITIWPAGNRAWFKVQAARGAAWIDEVIPRLKRDLERRV